MISPCRKLPRNARRSLKATLTVQDNGLLPQESRKILTPNGKIFAMYDLPRFHPRRPSRTILMGLESL